MKKITLLIIILMMNSSFGQNKLNGVVLNYATKKPIEYVDIYNHYNFTSTNSEGRFSFTSKNDSIKIRLIGYEAIFTTFNKIKSDTIFLKSKFEELDEIILSNASYLKEIYTSVKENYLLEPYTETFFLRCYIKKNGKLLKIQDLNGLVKRKTLFGTSEKPMPKKNYQVNVLNVRKAGIQEEDINFVMFNFKHIFDLVASVVISSKLYDFSENKSKNLDFIKYSFYPNSENKTNIEGYYLINKNDNAFTEYHMKKIDTNATYTENRGIKFRTTYFERATLFKKNLIENKYFIDKAKIKAETEVIDKNGEKAIYNVTYNLITLNQNNIKLNKKHSVKKDLFKFKKPYNSEFWKTQEYLLLTEEMNEFLRTIKKSNNEFKTTTNIEEY
ncbi:MAG: hypothetical protein ACI9JT_001528 [Polaribacter sp.]|jgi:hypothetical protein